MTHINKMDYIELVTTIDLIDRIDRVQGKKQHSQAIDSMPDPMNYWQCSVAEDQIIEEYKEFWGL